jgi:heme/copper-type cytochrome/quinol oxidase subunit 2
MTETQKTTLTDPVRTEQRSEILNQAFRGLLIIHGGGAVALLAYLQAVSDKNPALSKIILVGILLLVAGLILAVLFMAFRYHTSLEDQRGNPNWRAWRRRVFVFLYGSVAAFAFAMLVLVIGAFRTLPSEIPPNTAPQTNGRKPASSAQPARAPVVAVRSQPGALRNATPNHTIERDGPQAARPSL